MSAWRDVVIEPTTKGFAVDRATTVGELLSQPSTIFDGPFVWPLLVLDRAALDHNLALHAEFCRARGMQLAPHGKTTMAPAILDAQLAAGAWGMTAATISQVRAYRSFGIDRIVLANELVDERGIRWLLEELERSPEFDFWCYVDSTAGVDILRSVLADAPGTRALHVLVELGHTGGRTGTRDVAAALQVARSAASVDRLVLDGVSCYEGTVAGGLDEQLEAAAALVRELRAVVEALLAEELLDAARPFLVSGGGSAFFDAVAEGLGGRWPAGIEPTVVLRSGAYVTHDDGLYDRITAYRRLGEGTAPRPALHLWAQITSTPEPDFALAGFGKRDAPFDSGMPVPLRRRNADGSFERVTGWVVRQLNDHHAHLDASPQATPLRVGDLLEFGISHPCTAFDRWRFIPVVDDEHRVVDCIETFF